MQKRIIGRLVISLSLFLLYGSLSYLYVYAQERVDARVEAGQHYQQGKSLYSQGRYQEATTEFEKAVALITPQQLKDSNLTEIQFQERIQKEQEKVLATAGSSQEAATGFKTATPLIIPSEVEFEQKVQGQEEKVLAPPLPKLPSTREKLIEKRKKEQKKEIGATKTITTEAPAPETEEREYYIDVGDVLDISVWQIPDLSKSSVIVRPDGKISFPLIGDIKAEGLTLTRLDNIVTEKLKVYVKAPEVSVMITRFGEQANKIIILGEIPGPGVYKFSSPPTITEAIASAGGYTRYAVLNSIMVIRGDVRTKPEVARVNLAKIIKRGRLSENIFLKPNDIVYVPKSFIGNINAFLEIFQPAISEYMQYMNIKQFQRILYRKPD